MREFLQIGAFGVAGYLLYKYLPSALGSSPVTGGTTGGGTTGGTTGGSAGGGTTGGSTGGGTTGGTTGGSTGGGTTGGTTGGSTSGGTTGGGSSTQQQVSLAQAIVLAAGGSRTWAQYLDGQNVRFNVDQWNYYHVQAGQPEIAPGDMDFLLAGLPERGTQITATDYLNRLGSLQVLEDASQFV